MKATILGEAEMPVTLGIKSWFADVELSTSDYFEPVVFFLRALNPKQAERKLERLKQK